MKKIIRTAMLQDYTGSSKKLLPLLDEVAEKGYKSVSFSANIGKMEEFIMLCNRARSLGLSVCAFTGYMKYQYKYLADHPEQQMVSAKEFKDQDGIPAGNWGCPFHPVFKQRYLTFLEELAAIDVIDRIQVNDEAYLPGAACYCRICRDEYRKDFNCEMPIFENPTEDDWEKPQIRSFIKWNIDRWNHVHGEMTKTIHSVNKDIAVIFQASPANDLWLNPWSMSVDLAGMAEQLDGLSTDPYYTFHDVPFFTPKETYLGEWCRFLRGIVKDDQVVEIIPQGFSHPTFTRPLGKQDGLWSALIPPACGVDIITPYTYPLQRISPVLESYEKCIKLDKYFEKVQPICDVGVVHGVKTEIYRKPLPVSTPSSYDGTRLLPVTQSLKHSGISYGYIADSFLQDETILNAYDTIVFPQINCLSSDEEKGIMKIHRKGRNMVILGAFGNYDETGDKKSSPDVLEKLTGLQVLRETEEQRTIKMLGNHPVMEKVQTIDNDIAKAYMEGAFEPLYTLNCCVDAQIGNEGEVLAEFVSENEPKDSKPAIIWFDKKNILWFAGVPSRTSKNKKMGIAVRNMSHLIFPKLVEWINGDHKAALRVEGWPPDVPMKYTRPVDQRYMSTYEFFPMQGKDMALALVVSYFQEPSTIHIVFDVPEGRVLKEVIELIDGTKVEYKAAENRCEISFDMGFDDSAKLFAFMLKT